MGMVYILHGNYITLIKKLLGTCFLLKQLLNLLLIEVFMGSEFTMLDKKVWSEKVEKIVPKDGRVNVGSSHNGKMCKVFIRE